MDDFIYTSQYCEENVYKLLETKLPKSTTAYAIFITSPSKCTPIWRQKKSKSPDTEPVLWDYHVIAMVDDDIYDLDSTLPFPSSAQTYFEKTFPITYPRLRKDCQQILRIIDAKDFLEHFASDRSHMIGEDGKYLAPPPSYSCIRGKESTTAHNLSVFMDIEPNHLQVWYKTSATLRDQVLAASKRPAEATRGVLLPVEDFMTIIRISS
jgi:protein N-terminal glutamine amidohydrolase